MPQAEVTHVMSDNLGWPLQNPVCLSDFVPLGAMCFSETLIPQNWTWNWTLNLPLQGGEDETGKPSAR